MENTEIQTTEPFSKAAMKLFYLAFFICISRQELFCQQLKYSELKF